MFGVFDAETHSDRRDQVSHGQDPQPRRARGRGCASPSLAEFLGSFMDMKAVRRRRRKQIKRGIEDRALRVLISCCILWAPAERICAEYPDLPTKWNATVFNGF